MQYNERITQMEVYPLEVYQSAKLFGTDYNRKYVEGFAFYKPTHSNAILFIHVELVDGEILPKKDPENGMYTYVLCDANPYEWSKNFGTFHRIANVEGVNFWFKQAPVEAMISNMHEIPVGVHAKVDRGNGI